MGKLCLINSIVSQRHSHQPCQRIALRITAHSHPRLSFSTYRIIDALSEIKVVSIGCQHIRKFNIIPIAITNHITCNLVNVFSFFLFRSSIVICIWKQLVAQLSSENVNATAREKKRESEKKLHNLKIFSRLPSEKDKRKSHCYTIKMQISIYSFIRSKCSS